MTQADDDLYDPYVCPTGSMRMGTASLEKGQNRITLEITGAHERAWKRYEVGLDYVKLEPIK